MLFNFDVGIAQKHGLNAAIVYEYIAQGCAAKFYEDDPQFLREGKAWIRASVKQIHEDIPYLSVHQISYAIGKLYAAGLIEVDKFNDENLDTTKWYTLKSETSEERRNERL